MYTSLSNAAVRSKFRIKNSSLVTVEFSHWSRTEINKYSAHYSTRTNRLMVCPPATLPQLYLHPAFAFPAVGIQISEQHRQYVCHCLPFYVFDMFSAFVCPLFFEPVGCRHVTSLAVVFLVRAASNDPGRLYVA